MKVLEYFTLTEHPINKLAVDAVQAAPAQLQHRLEGGVSGAGRPADGFRERRLRRVHRAADQGDTDLQAAARHSYFLRWFLLYKLACKKLFK